MMMDEAIGLALELGNAQGLDWNYLNYDLYTIVSDGGIGSYAGIAQVGGRRSHLQRGYTSLRTAGHEFGHNLGLSHSFYNYTSDLNPRGDTPTNGLGSVEYGHRFSLMAAQSGSDFENPAVPHFTAHEKWQLDWLGDSDLADVTFSTQSGTYRLFQYDRENATGLRALRIPSGGRLPRYWLSYRSAWSAENRGSNNDYLLNGIMFNWTGNSKGTSTLLDMTPYSDDGSTTGSEWLRDNNDKWDASLLIGRTYTDHESGVSVTPLARGGAAPNEYIDVFVHLASGDDITLVGENDPCTAIVPTEFTANETEWTGVDFDDSEWPFSGTLGVGYDTNSDYVPYFNIDVRDALQNVSETCYLRIPFTIEPGIDPASIISLKLNMRYDDGFVAYLNGVKIASANAPTSPDWNSSAIASHADRAAIIYEEFPVDSRIASLVSGTNILAIHGLNSGISGSDFLIQPRLTATLSAPPNAAPTVSLEVDALAVETGQEITFTATGTDPDGDVLAYAWDFDITDTFAPEGLNQPIAVRRWNSPGYHTVTVTCSDRKGGTARGRILVKVGEPANDGLVSGRVLQGGLPVAGARVFIRGSDRACVTLDDGSYLFAGLSPSSGVTLGAMFDGEVFQPTVAMPLLPSAAGIEVDFLGASSSPADAPPRALTVSPYRAETDTTSSLQLTARIWDNTMPEDLLIPMGSTWRYLDTGIDPGSDWTAIEFSDAGWPAGPADLGYGDSQRTLIGYGGDSAIKNITTWFRHGFTATNRAEITRLQLSVKRDDGIRVFLNGTEVARDNLTTGTVGPNTRAINNITGSGEDKIIHFSVDPALLVEGDNVMAAEVHLEDFNDTDLRFDLQLSAARNLSELVPEWSVSPAGANITPAGVFSSNLEGTYTVTATSGDVSSTATVDVVTGTIVTIAALDSFLWENGSHPVILRVTRTGTALNALTVPLEISGNAIEGVDFTGVPPVVTFSPGELTRDFMITALDDFDLEGREDLSLAIIPSAGFLVGDQGIARVEILDDELPRISTVDAGADSAATVNILSTLAGSLTQDEQFVQAGDYWKFSVAGSAPQADWTEPTFDDATWKAGLAKFALNDGTTRIEFEDPTSDNTTAYFRRRFYLNNPADYANLTLGLLPGDGAVIYLNGSEVSRVNMPSGDVDFSTLALSEFDEEAFSEIVLNSADLIAGENIIAVEVHQASITNPDLVFDLTLTARRLEPNNVTFQWTQTAGPGTAAFTDALDPASSVIFDQPGIYQLKLEANSGGSASSDTVEITVEEAPPFVQWIDGFSLTDSRPLADPDLDGLSNLLEFATGSDPSEAASRNVPSLVSDPENPDDLLFSYQRPRMMDPAPAIEGIFSSPVVPEITYTLEASNSMTDWQPASDQITVEQDGLPVDNGDGSETVTLRLTPTPETSWYFRLRVTVDDL